MRSSIPLLRRAPRVAAVIPVYHARYLGEALESVFQQSCPPDEVFVVDDGSPEPDDLARAIAPCAGRITLLRQRNKGAAAARNRGIAAATAELVAFLDADDRWLPSFVAVQRAAFEVDAALDLMYADGRFVGRPTLEGRTFMSLSPSSGAVTLEALLAQRCTVLLSSVMARRSSVLAAGGFDEALWRGHDADLWFRMAQRGARMGYREEPLVIRRLHRDNLSGGSVVELERALRVFEKTLQTLPLSGAERAIAERRRGELATQLACERGKDLLARGDLGAARDALRQACVAGPGWKLRAALVGLRIAPSLVRHLYRARLEAIAAS